MTSEVGGGWGVAWEQQMTLRRPEDKLPGLSEGPGLDGFQREPRGDGPQPAQPLEWEEETSGSLDTRWPSF